MSVLSDFYGPPAWGTRYGVVDQYHPNGHHGLDLVHVQHAGIPALRAGRVVWREDRNSVLGNIIVVQVTPTDFDGYCHTLPIAKTGDTVQAGQVIGQVAGWDDFHGTAWTGPHTHLTNSSIYTGVLGVNTRDPAPVVLAVLGLSTASSNQSPLTDTEEEDMAKPILIQNTQPGTTNYGMVVLLGDNGYWTWLTAAQRDAWVFKGVEVWACTSGHFEYFIQTSRDQAAYLANLVGKAVPAAPAAPAVGDDELKALIAGIPDAVVKAQGAALSNG